MKKDRFKKRLPALLRISSVCLILLFLVVIGENLTEEKSYLWNDQIYSANASEQTDAMTVVSGDRIGTLTAPEYTFMVNADDKTASITEMKPNDDTTELVIPEAVTYNETTYTVTDINFDNTSVQYTKVKTITIPSSITGKILITSTQLKDVLPEEADTLERPQLVPFPNLEKVIFLGKTAPKSIDILSYLSYNDMIYKVPSGSEAAYEAVSNKSFSQPMLSHYDGDNGNVYKEYKVAPIVVSDTRNNPEPHLFQTEKGVYIITNNAAGGKGTVALIKCKELIRKYNYNTPNSGRFVYPEWDDYTIETEAVFGSYKYTVTSMNSGALLDFRKITMLTIPDTITKMEKDCIYAGDYLNFVFFSKNCKTISDDIFNSGENGAQNGVLFYVPSGVTKIEGTFQSFHLNQLYLPEGIRASKNLVKACDKIVYYKEADSSNIKNSINITNNKISVEIGSTKKINATNLNSNIKDTIHFINMDPSIADVSDNGIIKPKHKGTTYVLAFSEVTGVHQLIQLTVADTTFKKGIFTYRINYSKTPEVTVISCEPTKSLKVLNIPASVEYKGKKYAVTQVCAGDYVIDEYNWWGYTSELGYPRVYDTLVPLISDRNAKNINITEVVFPSTIKRNVASLGNLTKLKKIVFKGTKAPALIAFSNQNYNTAIIYVPSKALTAYKKTTWRKGNYEEFVYYNVYSEKSKIKLKTY